MDLTPKLSTPWWSLFRCCRPPASSDDRRNNACSNEDSTTASSASSIKLKVVTGGIVEVDLPVSAALASGGPESLRWLNDLLGQLWPSTSIVVSKMVKEIVEPKLAETLPGPLKSLRFTKLELGSVPPKFDNIDVHSRQKGFIKINLDIAWDGDSDIELVADRIPALGVRRVQLRGRVSLVLGPLVERLPVVSAVKIAFVNPPSVSLDFTGLANVADWSIIDDAVRKIIDDVLKGLMVLPQKMLTKLDPEISCFDAHQAPLGVCRITAVRGGGFKIQNEGSFLRKTDVPDIYLKIVFGAHPLWRTKTIKNCTDPEFGDSRDFLLSDHDQIVTVEAYDDDFGGHSADDYLGTGTVTIGKILSSKDNTVNISLENIKKGGGKHFIKNCIVTLRCDVFPLTQDVTSLDLNCNLSGLLTVIVANAYNIPGEAKDAASYVKVTFGKRKYCTPVIYDAPGFDGLNPSYDTSFLVALGSEDKESIVDTPVTFALMNGKMELGVDSVEYHHLLDSTDLTVEKTTDVGQGASIKFSVSLRGVSH